MRVINVHAGRSVRPQWKSLATTPGPKNLDVRATDEIGLGEHLDARFMIACRASKASWKRSASSVAGEDRFGVAQHGHGTSTTRTGCAPTAPATRRVPQGNRLVSDRGVKNTLEKDEEAIDRRRRHRQTRPARHAGTSAEEEDGAEGVQMMDLHASKGLEFLTCSSWAWKRKSSRTAQYRSRQHRRRTRLAYVGITRARRTLAFTFAPSVKQYGEIIDSRRAASR